MEKPAIKQTPAECVTVFPWNAGRIGLAAFAGASLGSNEP